MGSQGILHCGGSRSVESGDTSALCLAQPTFPICSTPSETTERYYPTAGWASQPSPARTARHTGLLIQTVFCVELTVKTVTPCLKQNMDFREEDRGAMWLEFTGGYFPGFLKS